MSEDLLQDLAQYKSHKDKSTSRHRPLYLKLTRVILIAVQRNCALN